MDARMLKRLVAATVGGIMSHHLRPILKRDFGGAWFEISCYVVGVVVAFPFVLWTYASLGGRDPDKMTIAYFFGYGGMGAGTVLGHYFMPDKEYGNAC